MSALAIVSITLRPISVSFLRELFHQRDDEWNRVRRSWVRRRLKFEAVAVSAITSMNDDANLFIKGPR